MRTLQHTHRQRRIGVSLTAVAVLCVSSLTGCTSFMAPIKGVPVRLVPHQYLAQPRANHVNLELTDLRQKPVDQYVLDSGDILGVYIEGILPPKTGEEDIAAAPPVNFPEAGSDLPPSVGYPITVRDDGTLALPLIDPIPVRGATLTEVEQLLQRAYTQERRILKPGRDRIIVTLMRERTVRVIVVREDVEDQEILIEGSKNNFVAGQERNGSGFVLDLPAYKNDLMHALAETGGLPGLNAKPEVRVLRTRLADQQDRSAFMNAFYSQYAGTWMTPPPLPDDPSTIRIPLRFPPGQYPQVSKDDVILEDGDIVYIEARDTEFFYTGGLMPGGQYPLPRDYDLDVLGAMSIAGQGVGGSSTPANAGGGAAGSILGGGFGGATPSLMYVFRKLPNGQELTIEVDLVEAMNNPGARILVHPGDTLILRYKPMEEIVNFSLVGFFTFGIGNLFD